MLFNSFTFLAFLPVVFILYWFVFKNSLKVQNLFLLAASMFFYGWWDWRFLGLMMFSACIDYVCGLMIGKTQRPAQRKMYLALAVCTNLGLLGFFKYYNFFIQSFVEATAGLGIHSNLPLLHIILPVGMSFYTFQAMSYSIDIYRNKLEPTKDLAGYLCFVSFFPQLVAGPIERAKHLLPQIQKPRVFNYTQARDGVLLVLYGMFKKVVIANTLAVKADMIFKHYEGRPPFVLLCGIIFFSFQIYADFSGYSDIAIGCSKLFGIEIMSNFRFPYFSRNIVEFWRRWHISLSTWFRDYVYIPLGGSKSGKAKTVRNIFIVFLVSGLWHGANWTFIVWGLIHALVFIPVFLYQKKRLQMRGSIAPPQPAKAVRILQIAATFMVVSVAWVFFRSPDVPAAIHYLQNTFRWETGFSELPSMTLTMCYVLQFVVLDYINRADERRLRVFNFPNKLLRYCIYLAVAAEVFYHFSIIGEQHSFIYFQF